MDTAGLAHDARTLDALLLACSHRGDVERARALVTDFVVGGGAPDLVTFNSLLTVYARALSRSYAP